MLNFLAAARAPFNTLAAGGMLSVMCKAVGSLFVYLGFWAWDLVFLILRESDENTDALGFQGMFEVTITWDHNRRTKTLFLADSSWFFNVVSSCQCDVPGKLLAVRPKPTMINTRCPRPRFCGLFRQCGCVFHP